MRIKISSEPLAEWKQICARTNRKQEVPFVIQNLASCQARINIYIYIYIYICIYKSRKVSGSRPDEVKEFFSIYLILLAALGSGVYSASNRNEYQKQKNTISGKQSAAGAQG
jgi:hypothetical protein